MLALEGGLGDTKKSKKAMKGKGKRSLFPNSSGRVDDTEREAKPKKIFRRCGYKFILIHHEEEFRTSSEGKRKGGVVRRRGGASCFTTK